MHLAAGVVQEVDKGRYYHTLAGRTDHLRARATWTTSVAEGDYPSVAVALADSVYSCTAEQGAYCCLAQAVRGVFAVQTLVAGNACWHSTSLRVVAPSTVRLGV